MAYLKAEELISGQEGRAYAQIGGKNEEMLYLKEHHSHRYEDEVGR